jgi:energy-coupling factor transporter ATP-binding protein EcfA2
MQDQAASQLAVSARSLRHSLASLKLPFETADVADGRAEIASALRQLDDHVLPRLDHLDAPALVVVGGSTGSGKSLLVNSLLGTEVSRSGVLRPTTTSPVLAHHPASVTWFQTGRILPDLARVTSGEAHGHSEIRLVSTESVPTSVALLDAPDIDSVSTENRTLAAQLLDAADLWVFVTTAARYADAVPWSFLAQAQRRGTPLVIVMNRVPVGFGDEVSSHLRTMLATNGLPDVEVFVIEEQPLVDGLLSPEAVTELRNWVDRLGSDHAARASAVRRSLTGAISELGERTIHIAGAVETQIGTADLLRAVAIANYDQAHRQVGDDISQGAVLKGEVLSRWEEVIGTGELMRQLRTGLGRLRDRVAGALTGKRPGDERLNGAVEHVAETLIRTRADKAADDIVSAWRSQPAGAQLVANAIHDLSRSSADLPERAGRVVRDWQAGLIELVRDAGADKRTTARVLSLGVNATAMVVMMVVFSHTGGLTGAEFAVAGGAGAVGHTLLEALLGDQAIRTLAAKARAGLDALVKTLYDQEANRFVQVIDAVPLTSEKPDELRRLAAELGRKA